MTWFKRWRKRAPPERFETEHFSAREIYREDYQAVAAWLLRNLSFVTALDIGCANGFLLEPLLRADKQAHGLELSPAVLPLLAPWLRSHVTIGDFTAAKGRFDLVTCVEVAEHIDPLRSEELVRTVARVARQWIYFTAAPPGQPGHGHINCRPLGDWVEWFAALGWTPAMDETKSLREELSRLERVPWLTDNSLVLRPAEPEAERQLVSS